MDFPRIVWDEEEDPDGNVQHIADHDLTVEDVEHVLSHPSSEGVSRSTSLPLVWGYASDDRYILVVYEEIDQETIRGITAYEVPEPRKHSQHGKEEETEASHEIRTDLSGAGRQGT